MRDKITSTEYELLNQYRDWYAWQDDKAECCKTLPVRNILSEWEESKGDLYTLLGKELIISKEFEFNKGAEELSDDMYNALHRNSTLSTRINHEGWKFIDQYREWVKQKYRVHTKHYWYDDELTEEQVQENDINIPITNGLYDLISTVVLVNNCYDGPDFTLTFPDNRNYIVRKGCKPMRVLAKIADAFSIPFFEEFRICHSLVHNQKRIKGKLSLSIHPLDYWTMSDNTLGWESCMSWQDTGGYRQGTVEMMNSPYVVVAYIADEDDMRVCNGYYWNNKKWRQLFIVSKDLILGIKDYPYHNENLMCVVSKWLKDLAKENLGWEYTSEEPIHWNNETKLTNPNYPDDKKFGLTFCSNHMYTDVGSLKWHALYLGKDTNSLLTNRNWSGKLYLEFNYSGKSQCMSCGDIDPYFSDSSRLCCDCCEQVLVCSECGERLYEDEVYQVGDICLCEYCYNERTSNCQSCEDSYLTEELVPIYVLLNLDDECHEWIKDNVRSLPEELAEKGYEIGFTRLCFEVCPACFNNFAKYYLKPNCKVIKYETEHGAIRYGCYSDDLTEGGIDSVIGGWCADDMLQGMSKLELLKKYWRYDYHLIRTNHSPTQTEDDEFLPF